MKKKCESSPSSHTLYNVHATYDIHTRIQCLCLCCHTLFIRYSYSGQNGVHLALEMSIVANCVSANTKCLCYAPNHWHATIQWMSSLVSESYLYCLMDLAPSEPSASMTSPYYFRSFGLLQIYSTFSFISSFLLFKYVYKLSSFVWTGTGTL